MRLPRSVGFTRLFISPGSVSGTDDTECREISGNTPEGFGRAQKAPVPLLALASTIDFRTADPREVEPFLESEYPKIRLAVQYALGWIDEVAVADTLFSAYGPDVLTLDTEMIRSPQTLLDRLMLRGLVSDVNDLMGTPAPRQGDWFSSTPVLAKFVYQLGLSSGLEKPLKLVSEAEEDFNFWLKRPRKLGLMSPSVLNDILNSLKGPENRLAYYYILTMSDEQKLSYPDGIFIDRMFGILSKQNPEEIFNVWQSAYEMLWDAGYRW